MMHSSLLSKSRQISHSSQAQADAIQFAEGLDYEILERLRCSDCAKVGRINAA